MKNLKKLLKRIFLFTLFFGLMGCVKDIDLDQVEDIQLKPAAVIDLVDFKLEADLSNNYDPGVPVKHDKTVPFELITDDLKESVSSVDLYFKYYNSLPRLFNGTILFLNDKNRVRQKIEFEIPPGTKEDPETFNFTHTFEGNDLRSLHQATKVRVELEMQPGVKALEGILQLQSSAAYRFHF